MHKVAALAAMLLMVPPAGAQPPLPPMPPPSEGFAADLGARLRKAMQAHVDKGELPGALMLVARHGHLVAEESVGWRDIARHIPSTPEGIYRLYSATKVFTAVTALNLVDHGELDLDAPVANYIPGFARLRVYVSGEGAGMVTEPLRRPVTVRDLLAHRSGLTYGGFGDSPIHRLLQERGVGMGPTDSLSDFIERLLTVPLLFQPGERWEYGLSSDVLGYVIASAAGKPFDVVMEERVLAPLGLADTAFAVPPAKRARMAPTYFLTEKGLETRPRRTIRTAPEGGAGLYSTVGDFARFAQMLCNGGILDGHRILKPETVAMMNVNQVPAGGPSYGLGVGIESDPEAVDSRGPVGSFGWSGAGQVHFWVDPTEHVIGIFLAQTLPYTIDRDTEMRTIVYGALAPSARESGRNH
jgi:CubicO group peptidase (beta-lactamase class C family)